LSRQQKDRSKRYQALFKAHVSDEELGRVRTATQSDMTLVNDRFKEDIEMLTGMFRL
jgi:putative transposase